MTFFKALEELNKSILKKFPNDCIEYNSDDEKQLKFVMTPKLKENNGEYLPLKKVVLKAKIGDYLFLKDVEWYMLFQSTLDEQEQSWKCNLSDFPITSISKLFLKDYDWETEIFFTALEKD
jgi:hypothetical protein